jgi:hypothetical protein
VRLTAPVARDVAAFDFEGNAVQRLCGKRKEACRMVLMIEREGEAIASTKHDGCRRIGTAP